MMNISADAMTILCYGDSNTWGQKPDKSGRYPSSVRWTGQLQDILGSNYYIVEEGLSSRTTDLDYEPRPGRNGKTYLIPCLASHNPIDTVVIMLGTNDLKTQFGRKAEEIAQALVGLADEVRSHAWDKEGRRPKILLVSPIEVNDQAPRFTEFYTGIYDTESRNESLRLPVVLEQLAGTSDCLFADAAAVAKPGEDGLHMDAESHSALAKLIVEGIRK